MNTTTKSHLNQNLVKSRRYSYIDFVKEMNQIVNAINDYLMICDGEYNETLLKNKKIKFPNIKIKTNNKTNIQYFEFELFHNYKSKLNNDENKIPNEEEDCFFNFDFKVLYSEVFDSPIMYFNISNSNGEVILIENYFDKKNDNNYDGHIFQKSIFEIEKSNFPLNGLVYYSLYLCNFSQFLNNIYSLNSNYGISDDCNNNKNYNDTSNGNIILIWLSTIFNYFDFKVDEFFYKFANKL